MYFILKWQNLECTKFYSSKKLVRVVNCCKKQICKITNILLCNALKIIFEIFRIFTILQVSMLVTNF